MKFQIQKKLFAEGFERLHPVATKGLKSEYDMANRITMIIENDNLVFLTSNGSLHAHHVVGPVSGEVVKGTVTVDVNVGRAIAKAIGSPDSMIEVEKKDDSLVLRDLTAQSTRKRKVTAKMQILSKNHEFQIPKPSKNGFAHSFKTETFVSAIQKVGKYKCPLKYKTRYQLLCLHFLSKESRFVCGDGMRFAVLVLPYEKERTDTGESGVKYLLPVEQSYIISSVICNSESVNLVWKNQQECHIEAENITMLLQGIPKEEYINYEVHAFRQDEAKSVVDVLRNDLIGLVALAGSTRDQSMEAEGKFHSIRLSLNKEKFEVICDEGKYQCDAECDCSYWKLEESQIEFEASYCWDFFNDIVSASGKDVIRLYCIDEKGIMLADLCNLGEEKDEKGISKIESEDGSRFLFFFAAATDDSE